MYRLPPHEELYDPIKHENFRQCANDEFIEKY